MAAETLEAAEQALGLIAVEYEVLPAVFDPLEAMRAESPLLHDDIAHLHEIVTVSLEDTAIANVSCAPWRVCWENLRPSSRASWRKYRT